MDSIMFSPHWYAPYITGSALAESLGKPLPSIERKGVSALLYNQAVLDELVGHPEGLVPAPNQFYHPVKYVAHATVYDRFVVFVPTPVTMVTELTKFMQCEKPQYSVKEDFNRRDMEGIMGFEFARRLGELPTGTKCSVTGDDECLMYTLEMGSLQLEIHHASKDEYEMFMMKQDGTVRCVPIASVADAEAELAHWRMAIDKEFPMRHIWAYGAFSGRAI